MASGQNTEGGKVFNDPIHGHIELHPLLVEIIDTPQFQRLRHIKQLGGVYSVYPGASHNRFEHSIGVAHLAGELAESLRKKNPELLTPRDVLCVQIAGLCHDLGHGPLSHLFDGIFLPKVAEQKTGEEAEKLRKWKHEKGSCDMFDYLVDTNNLEPKMIKYGLVPKEDITFIKEMFFGPLETDTNDGETWKYKGRGRDKSFLYEIVSNKSSGVDVDKFDYFARDSYHLGIQNNFDHRRFIKFAKVCKVTEDGEEKMHICIRDKEADNMYDMFYTRHCLHRRAYQHKVNKIIEHKMAEALVKADDHIKIEGSRKRKYTPSTAIKDMEAYTKLTDHVFEQIINYSSDELSGARTILQDIVSRKLPKFVGETRPQNSIKDQEKLISDWKNYLAQQLDPWTPEDFKVLVVKMNYGMKDRDPVKHMYFYSKLEPNVAKKIPTDQGERIRTTCFSETLLMVYYNKLDDLDGYKTAKDNLDQWWNDFLQQKGEGTAAQQQDSGESNQINVPEDVEHENQK
ncbi:deoxynucleoside triphosphate triphosphohydrolase SAMHD1-like [Xyrichtys novacula]|uniref:Deoxynucleoside triphosphate triphosphohydrolase SAMHD1-like n=1 Tax=Xyrichtys novacula TaxID=13765 RepID=A0AAV1HGU4_XYRNO|nr:deoxynucleoside triphosphate triphosphohydrolase SAMHD1-like [Xyrichtys novacula]